MKIYNFKETYNVEVVGDIHGQFNVLFKSIKDIKDTIFIIAGDCGFGFESPLIYKNIIEPNLDILIQNNIIVLCIRGNHDDPSFFGGENNIDYENFKTIEDYSVIQIGNNNILCIGGGLSIDRTNRIQNDNRNKKYGKKLVSYWFNEFPIYDENKLNEIINSGIEINNVISHVAPTEFFPHTKEGIISWYRYDKDLEKDADIERGILSKILNYLINKNCNLKGWYYGHYHTNHNSNYNNIETNLIGATTPYDKKLYHKTLR